MCPGFDSWFRRLMLVDFIAASPFRAPTGFSSAGYGAKDFPSSPSSNSI